MAEQETVPDLNFVSEKEYKKLKFNAIFSWKKDIWHRLGLIKKTYKYKTITKFN